MDAELLAIIEDDGLTDVGAMDRFIATHWAAPRIATDMKCCNIYYTITFGVRGGSNTYGVRPADGLGWEVWRTGAVRP